MPDHRPPRRDMSKPKRPRLPTEKGEKSYPGDRLAKVIARAGLASRRDVEAWITAGRVSVNGHIVDTPAINVDVDAEIEVDGKPLPKAERTRLFLYHKPRGRITTARDPEGRATVFDDLPAELPRLLAVGRLDFNTEGLLLLTNDGGLKRLLELPSTGWLRRYRVRAFGETNDAVLSGLAEGLTVDEIAYGPIEARVERKQGDNMWLMLGLREGKNREVRIILEHLGLEVNRLIRVSYGPFQLGEIAPGQVMEVPRRRLRDQLGQRLADEAGVDFDGPVRHHSSARAEAPEPGRDPGGHRVKGKPHFAGRATAKAEAYANLQAQADRPARATKPRIRATEQKIERSAETGQLSIKPRTIADRKGRAIVVAKKTAFRETTVEAGRKSRVSKRPFREPSDQPRRPMTDNGERPTRFGRFKSEGGRGDDRPSPRREGREKPWGKPGSPGERTPRGPKSFGDAAARPPRAEGFRNRPPRRDGEGAQRPPRPYGDRPARPPRREFAEGVGPDRDNRGRPPRAEGFRDRPPRRDGEGRDKPWAKPRPTGEGGKPRTFGGGKPRSPGAGPKPDRPRYDGPRAPAPGGKPRGPRPPRRGQ